MLIDDDEVRMCQLQSPVEPRHLAGEDPSGARVQLVLPVTDQARLPEESADHIPPTIGDGGLESRLAPSPNVGTIIKIEGFGIHHLCHYRNFLTVPKHREVAQLGAREVAARYQPHEIADREDLQRLEKLRRLGAENVFKASRQSAKCVAAPRRTDQFERGHSSPSNRG